MTSYLHSTELKYLIFSLFLLIFPCPCLCEEDSFGVTDLPSSLEHLQSQNEQAMDFSTFPSAIVAGCVNVITGDYFEHVTDVVLPGTGGFKIERSYSSRACKRGTFQYGWDINHGGKVLRQHSHNHMYGYVKGTERSGTLYQSNRNDDYDQILGVHQSFLEKGITNCNSGEISANTNLKNDQMIKGSSITTLTTANQTCYVFMKEASDIDKTDEVKVSRLVATEFPNGLKYYYQYNPRKRLDALQNMSVFNRLGNKTSEFLMKNGTAFNSTLSEVTYQSEEGNYGAKYQFAFYGKDLERNILKTVESLQHPTITYSYEKVRGHAKWRRMTSRELPEGRFQRIEYHPKDEIITVTQNPESADKVKALFSPAGLQGQEVSTYQFEYERNKNDCSALVKNALGQKTVYRWNKSEKRLLAVEHFDKNDQLVFKERTFWCIPNEPYIKGVAWQDGKGLLLAGRHFEYSTHYNVACETFYGNLTGHAPPETYIVGDIPFSQDQYKIHYEYDDRQRLISKREGELTFTYTYDGKTDLLASEFTYYDGRIQIRKFYEHDESAALSLEIMDDGSSENQEVLKDVTERKIKRIKNNKLGLPLEVTEYALDLSKDQKIQLKRTFNTYNNDFRLTKQIIHGRVGCYSHQLTWEYDAHGNVESETDALGFTTVRSYDANDNLISEIKPHEAARLLTYDKMNRLTSEEYLVEPYYKKVFTYDPLGNMTSSTDIYGNTTYFTYDDLGHLSKTIYPQVLDESGATICPEMNQTCDPFGRVIAVTDPRGNTVTSSYNSRGKPTCIDYPDGSQERFYYTLSGELEHSIGRDGSQIHYTYDPQNREIKKVWLDASGNILKLMEKTYNAFHLLSETDSMGVVTVYTYDFVGRISSKTTGNKKTTYGYDLQGRESIVREEFEDGTWIAHVKKYNARDKVISEHDCDFLGNISNTINYRYSASGKCISKTVENSLYLTEYDPFLRIKREIDPEFQQTLYRYSTELNSQGIPILVKEITDSRGTKTVITHDALGRIVQQESFDVFGELLEHITTFYDPSGNKAKQVISTKDTPIINCYEYNAMGRLILTTEALGTQEQKTVSRQYDHSDRLISLKKADGVILSYAYDRLGRISTLNSSDGSLAFAYTYDLNDNILSLQDHELKITRSYDIHNQLNAEVFPYGEIKYSYDEIGRLIQVTLPDHSTVATTYQGMKAHTIERQGSLTYEETFLEYDRKMNLTKAQAPHQTGLLEYSYDSLSRPVFTKTPHFEERLTFSKGLVVKRDVQDALGSQEANFQYDGLKRLLKEEGIAEHSFTYDMLGNAITFDDKARDFNARNALLGDSEKNYTYDLNGNRLHDGKNTYSYDALDRLITADTENGFYTYQYDPSGRRLFKKHSNETIAYLWQQEEEIGAVSSDNTLLEFRALDPHGRPFALELHGKLYIPIQDAYGHIRSLVDPEANVSCATYRYSAFGDEQIYGNILSPWRFAGKRVDAETGLIYFGKRYYDPKSFSWTTPDPLEDADGFNLYAYVHHNPLLYIDRDGCFSLSDWVSSSTILEAVAVTVAAGTVIGWGALGFAEGFLAGCGDGILATCIDFAADGAALYSEGATAYAEMDAATKAYYAFKTAGKVGGALYGSCTPSGKVMQTALSAGSTAMKAAKVATAGAKVATAAGKTGRVAQKVGSVAQRTFSQVEKGANCVTGRKGWQLQNAIFQPVRNQPAIIRGMEYSGHALDQMQNRGFVPSLIENTISHGTQMMKGGKAVFYEPINNISVVKNPSTGRIITTFYGKNL